MKGHRSSLDSPIKVEISSQAQKVRPKRISKNNIDKVIRRMNMTAINEFHRFNRLSKENLKQTNQVLSHVITRINNEIRPLWKSKDQHNKFGANCLIKRIMKMVDE